jgi:Arc/MetJ-type ribon-helix-helix transcriptional regulator
MTIQLKPEQERIIQEEIQNGHFRSPDEVLDHALAALREKSNGAQATVAPPRPRKKLYDLLTQPPFAGSELNLERQKDYPRPVDL